MTLNFRPSCSAGSETRSRVTPGSPYVMARRFPVIRLKRVDFPTFGRPTREAVNPVLFIPQPTQLGLVAAPVLLDLHEQLQVYPFARLFLQFQSRLRPDRLQHAPPAPDDDPLLRFALDDDLRADPRQVLLGVLPVLFDRHRDAVRKLRIEVPEQLLADHL